MPSIEGTTKGEYVLEQDGKKYESHGPHFQR